MHITERHNEPCNEVHGPEDRCQAEGNFLSRTFYRGLSSGDWLTGSVKGRGAWTILFSWFCPKVVRVHLAYSFGGEDLNLGRLPASRVRSPSSC
jgi:hypothetical protein